MRARGQAEGLRLMLGVADEPTPQLIRAFDAYFYPLVVHYVRKRRYTLGRMAGRAAVPDGVLPADRRDEAAHMTAVIALNRARASAKDFDPERGTAEDWVLRAAAWAFQETTRDLTDRRRRLKLVATDDDELQRQVDDRRTAPDTFEIVAARERLASIFELLTAEEQHAVILCRRDGHTYAEAAEILFGDAEATKRIDRLLQSATVKLRSAPPTT